MAQLDTIALLATALANSKREDERRRDRNRQDKAERYGQSMDAISKSVAGVGQSLDAYGRIQEHKADREARLAQELVDRQFRTRADTRAQEEHDYNMAQDERARLEGEALNNNDIAELARLNPGRALQVKKQAEAERKTAEAEALANKRYDEMVAKDDANRARLDASGVVVAGAPEVPGAKAEIAAKEGEAQQSLMETAPQHELVQKVEAALPNAQPGIALQAQKMMQGIDKDTAKQEAEQAGKAAILQQIADMDGSPTRAEALKDAPLRTINDTYATLLRDSIKSQSIDPLVTAKRADALLDGMVEEGSMGKYDPILHNAKVIAAKDKARALIVNAPDHLEGIMAEFRKGLDAIRAEQGAQVGDQ